MLCFVPSHHQLIDFKELEQVFLSVPSTNYANTCMLTENSCSKLSISTSHEMLRFSIFPESDFLKIRVFPKAICKAKCNILQNFSLKLKLSSEMFFSFCNLLFHNTQTEMNDIML